MYIAVCDDQIEELEKLTALLQAWQSDRRSDVRFQTFRSGSCWTLPAPSASPCICWTC